MKKSMIKSIALILILVTVIGLGTTSFAAGGSLGQDVYDALKDVGKSIIANTLDAISNIFKDIKQTDWFADTVGKLIDIGGINGYPDGTFKPNNTITRAEFTKILVSALGHKDLAKTSTHWASGFVDKAVSMKLTSKDELKDLDKPIPRKEMAKMVANALDYRGETHIANRNDYKGQIKDFNSISSTYQDFVLKAYTKGIITGYPDGTFGGDKGLTRAEASTVILRIIDASERKIPTLEVQNGGFIEPIFEILEGKSSGGASQPSVLISNYHDYDDSYEFKGTIISPKNILVATWRDPMSGDKAATITTDYSKGNFQPYIKGQPNNKWNTIIGMYDIDSNFVISPKIKMIDIGIVEFKIEIRKTDKSGVVIKEYIVSAPIKVK